MRRGYNIMMVMMCIAILILIILLKIDKKDDEPVESTEDTTMTEQQPIESVEDLSAVSRGLAIKIIALLFEEKATIMLREREIEFSDTSSAEWFDKYFNTAIIEGWLKVDSENLRPLDPLTYKELKDLLSKLNVTEDELSFFMNRSDSDFVTYLDFAELCEVALDKIPVENQPEVEELYIFATPKESGELGAWECATDLGKYTFEGISLDQYMYKRVEAVIRDREILYITGVSPDRAILENAYIADSNSEDHTIHIFMGGITQSFPSSEGVVFTDPKGIIADITIEEGVVTSLDEKEGLKKGIIKMISEETIEVEGMGKLKLAKSAKFYDVLGDLRFLTYSDILVGYESSFIVTDGNEVVAVLLEEEAMIQNIRVVLGVTGFTSLVHAEVRVTSTEDYQVLRGDGSEQHIAGDVFSTDGVSINVGERIQIVPAKEGKIQVLSIDRGPKNQTFHPSYRGFIEIERIEEGYLIVNEVDFEEYLYGVVPSEMPTSYGLEAAKVQAICARSYAYSQMQANRFAEYGAHVDDSIQCQVYNNIEEVEQSIQAVNETKGLLLCYDGKIVSANFFSTSCGVTANSGEVWANNSTGEFPTTSTPFLQSKYQDDQEILKWDLQDEGDFKEFIQNKEVPSFDATYPWYRWAVEITGNQLEAVINQNIGARYIAAPRLIKTLEDDKIFRTRTVEDIGELKDVWVYSRGECGIVTELMIQGSKGVYKVSTEYNIRTLLAPKNLVNGEEDVKTVKMDQSISTNLSLLPSAFFTLEKLFNGDGSLDKVIISGGGYGHGVGMSQNGVKTMVEKGYTYPEILSHYYTGSEITLMDDYLRDEL